MKQCKILLCAASLLLVAFGAKAQQTIGASGGEANGTGGSSSYTVGQPSYTFEYGSNGSVGQGVQQPWEISTITGIEIQGIDLEVVAYPNPTTNYLHLRINNLEMGNLTYQLYDMKGQLIQDKSINSSTEVIDMNALPSAIYFLRILHNNQSLKEFKICKS